MDTCTDRVERKYQENLEAAGSDLNKDPLANDIVCFNGNMPTGTSIIKNMLLDLGVDVWCPVTDGDTLTMTLAQNLSKEKSIGPRYKVVIITNDSDFYLFRHPKHVNYCSVNDFMWLNDYARGDRKFYNKDELSIKCFDQKFFCNHMGLDVEDLYLIVFF